MNADDKAGDDALSDADLAKAETALQLEADKRMRAVKAEAADESKDADEPKHVNPDG